jgi:hypothetical protein
MKTILAISLVLGFSVSAQAGTIKVDGKKANDIYQALTNYGDETGDFKTGSFICGVQTEYRQSDDDGQHEEMRWHTCAFASQDPGGEDGQMWGGRAQLLMEALRNAGVVYFGDDLDGHLSIKSLNCNPKVCVIEQ